MQDEAVNTSGAPELETPTNEPVEQLDFDGTPLTKPAEVAPKVEPAPVEEPVKADPVEDAPQDEPKEDSPRYEKRIRQLSAKVKELKTQAPVAPQVQATPPAPLPAQAPSVPLPQLPEGDYTVEEINAWATQQAVRTGQALSSIEVAQLRAELAARDEFAEVQTTYSDDLHAIEGKYAELNEDSPEFDPHLTQVVTELYEEQLIASPKTASLSKIAERVMEVNRRTAAKSAAAAAKAVATQKDSSALAPTGDGPKSTPPEDHFLKGFKGE